MGESEILQIFPDLRVLGPRVMGPKRPNLSLDLNATGGKRKQAAQNAGILNSPDVNKLKLTSPQIKLLIEQGHTGVTPTISAAAGSNTAQTGYVFPPTAATVNQVLCTSSVFLVKGYYRISCNLEGCLDLGLCLDVNLEF